MDLPLYDILITLNNRSNVKTDAAKAKRNPSK